MRSTQSMAIVFEKFHFSVTAFIRYVKKGGKTGQKHVRFETKKDTCMRSGKNDSKLHVWTEKLSYEKRKICVLNSKQRSVDRTQKPTLLPVQVLFVSKRVGSRCQRGSRQRLNSVVYWVEKISELNYISLNKFNLREPTDQNQFADFVL